MDINKVLTNTSQSLSEESKLTARKNIESFGSADVAEEFSDQSTYKVGDIVVHETRLYRCKVAIPTAGSWNSNNWEFIKIVDSFKSVVAIHGTTTYNDIKSALSLDKTVILRYPLNQTTTIYFQANEVTSISDTGYIEFIGIQSGNGVANDKIYRTRVNNDDTWSNVEYTEISPDMDLSGIICNEYSPSATYNKNSIVLHENILYRCNSDNVTGSWDGTKWIAVHVMDIFIGATLQSGGAPGLVPAPSSNDLGKFLGGDGSWHSIGLKNAITASISVGGVNQGDSFAVGTSYDDVLNALLNPTLYPTLTDPSVSLSYSNDTYYEVGSSISSRTATATLNRGSINPAYGTSGYRSGEATNYAISTTGADTEYSSSSASSGSFSIPALTRSTKGNIVLTATVSYAVGEQPKDSKGSNYSEPLPAGSKSASKTMQFILAYYYGKSASPTISNFSGMSKSVTIKGQKQFSFTTNNEHMVIAYDSSYGDLTSILDQNGFETISGWTKSTLVVDGFSYYVYVANSPTTDTNAQFTFKY